MTWTRALDLSALPDGASVPTRPNGVPLALFRDGDVIRAIDLRCPHEGYPLTTGSRRDGVLTCSWHNWKFRLADGACLYGGEGVRSWPVRVEDGAVWVDLTPPTGVAEGLYADLRVAFDEADWGRAGRAVARLLRADQTPEDVLGFGVDWGARHAPDGFDHGLAAAADLAALIAVDAEVALLEALELMVMPNVRRPERALPAAEAPTGTWEEVGLELRVRLESDDRVGAEALLRGSLAAGAGPDVVFGWLDAAVTDHFYDYGHAHIYAVKAEELLAAVGWKHADAVLSALITMVGLGTREDTLPYMKGYTTFMSDLKVELYEADPDVILDVPDFVRTVLDGKLEEALGAVAGAIARRVAPTRIALALGKAAAIRLLRFDRAIDADPDVGEFWLDVTHCLTHADAVHETLRRRPSAAALRGLFQSARFIQHLHVVDGAQEAVEAVSADTLRAQALEDRAVLPIFVAHHVKTALAAIRLSELGAGEEPMQAATRFLASPISQRRVARNARIGRDFVRTGHKQKRLLGY